MPDSCKKIVSCCCPWVLPLIGSWTNFNSMCNSGFESDYTIRAPPTHSVRILTASQTAAPCSTGPRNNRASHRNSTSLRYACRRACHFLRRCSTFEHRKILHQLECVYLRAPGWLSHLLCLLLSCTLLSRWVTRHDQQGALIIR